MYPSLKTSKVNGFWHATLKRTSPSLSVVLVSTTTLAASRTATLELAKRPPVLASFTTVAICAIQTGTEL